MRLKSIKLAGFKSFVDPTTAHFPTQLSAVVGPNGCGKSNIIDAVRWVMGESSAKNLRGESMTDVIFNGSTARKPVAQASIELVFDNADATLGGEYAKFAEISVKRLVTRDAKSDYFLNGTRCRRKDITDIFLGTGLGPRSYAIIEQGMISRLIEAKPDELRVYIEEAAGISKYKDRRKETETRMRHTRENLDRLNDVREELDKRIAHLERQAQSAEKYKEYKEEERQLRAQLLALRWQSLDKQVAQREQLINELEIRLEAEIAGQRAAEAELEKHRLAEQGLVDDVSHVQQRFYQLGNEIDRIHQSLQHQRERHEQLKIDLAQAERSYEQAAEHLATDEQELEKIRIELVDLEPQQALADDRRDELNASLADAEERMQLWQQQWDDFNQFASDARQKADVERSRIQHLEQGIQRWRGQLDRLDKERQQLVSGPLAEEVAVLNEQLASVELELETAQETVERTQQTMAEQRERNNQTSTELDRRRDAVQSRKSRRATLEALQQAAFGQGEDVQHWLDAQGLARAPRLAESLTVTPGWERAAETVLADSLQAVRVDDVGAQTTALDSLAAGHLTLIDGHVAPAASSPNGTPLSQHVHGPEAVTLLAGIYAAESLDDALALRPCLAAHESVITRDGIWLGPNWLRLRRQQQNESGVLQRQQELETLTGELETLEAQFDELTATLHEGRDQLRTLESRRDDAQKEQSRLIRARGDVQAHLGAKQVRLEQMQARQQRLDHDEEEAKSHLGQDQEQLAEARVVLEQALERMAEDADKREALLAERERVRAALDGARQAVRAERDSSHQVALTLQSLRTREAGLQQSLSRLHEQLETLTERREILREALMELETPAPEIQDKLDELLAQRVTVEEELQHKRRHLESVQHAYREIEKRRQRAEQQAQQIRDMGQSQRLEWQNALSRREAMADQLKEDDADLQTVLSTIPDDANEGAWQEELERIAGRISRLGSINLAAIDEYKQESERKSYLDAQHKDLEDALETLERAIRDLDKETRTLFKDTYDKVNAGLQHLFPKVFGGGHAYLELVGEDLLECGVAIMARPPGKRNSTIHLLSGGEKALTALSLVFSIFQLNPAPFCMLDEVDAPLDDANVGRFARLVEEMSGQVQFIYITHNKIAMEMAHQLMGVTMHEPGVSRLVSVNVEEAAEMATV